MGRATVRRADVDLHEDPVPMFAISAHLFRSAIGGGGTVPRLTC